MSWTIFSHYIVMHKQKLKGREGEQIFWKSWVAKKWSFDLTNKESSQRPQAFSGETPKGHTLSIGAELKLDWN